MVDMALNSILLDGKCKDVEHLAELHSRVMEGKAQSTECLNDKAISTLKDILQSLKDSLNTSKTSQLWIQYSDMVFILRKFILAERIGHWNLHLQTLREMLQFMAAAGHNY